VRRIKKYIYPLAFSAMFMILYSALCILLDCVVENGSYAGAALAILFAGAWAVIVVPIYCVKYSKVVYKETYKYIFAVYSGLALSFSHLMFFDFDSGVIGGMFFLWVLLLTLLFLALRLYSEKQADNGGEDK